MSNALSKTVCDLIVSCSNFWLFCVTFGEVQVIKTDLRSMTRSSNSIKPTLSSYIRLLYNLDHIRRASILLWLHSKD